MNAWRVATAGTERFGKADVITGGVGTNELSARTMESRKGAGPVLYRAMVDVTGQLGGFNFP